MDKYFEMEKSDWLETARKWKKDLPWIRYSRSIALEIIDTLNRNGVTHQEFGHSLGLSQEEVSMILSGRKDFTLSEISKIEYFLSSIKGSDIRLLSVES